MKQLLTVWFIISSLFISSQVAAQNNTATRPDVQKGAKLFSEGDDARGIVACVSCHGAGGNSAIESNPKLAGQHADYIFKQLMDFSLQPNAKSPKRENAVMGAQVANLTTEDKRNIAAYLESQPLTDQASASMPLDQNTLGQRIFRAGIPEKGIPACAACHGPGGMGIPSQYPRLSGQFAAYTKAQLEMFREEERLNSDVMKDISANLNNRELKAVSDYISGLRELR